MDVQMWVARAEAQQRRGAPLLFAFPAVTISLLTPLTQCLVQPVCYSDLPT